MRKGKDPEPDSEPYIWLMDPEGPKTYGSGSPTLLIIVSRRRSSIRYRIWLGRYRVHKIINICYMLCAGKTDGGAFHKYEPRNQRRREYTQGAARLPLWQVRSQVSALSIRTRTSTKRNDFITTYYDTGATMYCQDLVISNSWWLQNWILRHV
jgi:hypothetical protein